MIVPFTELPEEAGGRPRPVLDVVIGDMEDILIPCLVDSGALHTLLPRWVAEAGALSLEGGRSVALAVAAASTSATFTKVRMSAAGHAWEGDIGFCDPWPYAWGLLGQSAFFRFFTVTFRAADFAFEVDPITE